jgi:hypothetical protein
MFNKFFSKNCAIYEIHVEKYGRARQATDDDVMQHMHLRDR